nr:tandem-95 repeat protein [uncultured Agitococcus sp.]
MTLNEDNTARFNPLFNDTDTDGDNLIFRVLSQPSKGQIVVNSDNTISYTPNANYSGEDSFTYQVNDGQANSNVATVRLHIAAVADAPILTINNNSNPTRELFRTSWESVSDRNYTSTLVEQTQLEGWTLLTKPDNSRGGSNGFEIWSSDDRMADSQNKKRTVTAMIGNGNNWLELNNARNNMAQSLGIQRQVDTVAGATYTLSMDVAGRLGYSSDYTKIGIYVDGVRIGDDDSTSGNMALNWQAKQFSFVGNGRKQTIQILGEATKQDGIGRGMMIDDIILTERLANNTGLEDISIKLSAISARLKDDDDSETLALTIEAIPVGATLSDGTRSFTATSTNRTVNITTWNLSNFSLTPPKDFNGTINLQVKATATERSNGSTASTTETLTVKVLPVNDAPIAQNATFTVQRNGSVRIDFSQLVSDVDGDILSLIPNSPSRGTLSKNSDGSYTYTPRRNYTGTDRFTYTVNDGTSCVQATISLVVQNPNNDDDDCHRQSITIQSVYANNTANNTPSYVVINNNSTSPSSSIVNWDIFAPQVGITLQPQMLTSQEEETNLAVLTGLVVKKG